MHLAFVTSLIPDTRPSSGYEVANRAIIDGLRALGHRVSIFGFIQSNQAVEADEDTHILDVLDVENARASKLQKLFWLLKSLQSGTPVGAAKLKSYPEDKLLDVIRSEGPFDRIVMNSFQMASAFPKIMDVAPFCYVAHNVEHLTAKENSAHSKSWMDRLLYNREARLLGALEEMLCQKAKFVWCLSDQDRRTLCQNSDNSATLPLINAHSVGSNQQSPKKTHDVGLIGTWTWRPNLLGLQWFLENVVPQLAKDISISIAGSIPEGLAQENPRVNFVGRVDNANDFVKQSRLIALVSQGGTGVQLKTIEAFQSGTCCVATSSSLRGVKYLPENCRHADIDEEFAREVEAMIDAIKNGSVSDISGRAFFEKQYTAMLENLQFGLGLGLRTTGEINAGKSSQIPADAGTAGYARVS